VLNLREYRRTADRLADHLPWAALVAPGIVLNTDGSFQRTLAFRGPDLESATEAELVSACARANNVLKRFGSGWALFFDAERREALGYPDSAFPDAALVAFSLGCDWVNVGREALLSIGCIQALRCHTNKCPTGITTQSPWLTHGLDPELKAVRLANYVLSLRKELLILSRACGVQHPSLVSSDRIEILNDRFGAQTVEQLLGGRGRGTDAGAELGDGIAEPLTEPLAPLVFRRNPRPAPVWPPHR